MKRYLLLAALAANALTPGCKSPSANAPVSPGDTTCNTTTTPLREKVLTAEEQKTLSPDAVIESLKEGNKRFVSNALTIRDHSAMVRNAAGGQYPKAVVLSCLDSRIPVEDVFDKGIGDLFIARLAGNVINDDVLGSMEYGCKVSGAKLVLVLGHGSCGAIKSAIDDVELGNITVLLAKIRPVVAHAQNFEGDKTTKNEAFVDYVAKQNVLHAIDMIKRKSPILGEMEKKGEIKIVGAFYDIKTGAVTFL
jgi:carbonic anhydrase